jgi:hypothetical protein
MAAHVSHAAGARHATKTGAFRRKRRRRDGEAFRLGSVDRSRVSGTVRKNW